MAAADRNEFFNILSSIFTDKEKFNEYSNLTLDRNSFMINRTMSINFPLQANVLNMLKINGYDVVKSWNTFISQQYRTPGFIYTKGSQKAREDKEKKVNMPKKQDIVDYCLTYNIEYKSVMDAMKFYKEEMIKEINDFLKIKEQLK